MPLKQQQQKHQQRDKEEDKYPIIYHVTSSGLALQTRQNYERDINQFFNHFNIKDIEPLKEYSLQVCKQMIIDYVIHLRENKKLSRASIKFHLYAIRHFFFMIREDEFPIRWNKINIELPPHEYSHRDRGYTVRKIQSMLELGCKSRLRDKAVILLLTSAGGMRIGGIPNLKKGDLKEMYTTAGDKVYGIRVYSDSSQDYFTPCSPECTRVLDKYFDERTAAGEQLKYESSVIRNLYSTLNAKRPKPLTLEGVKYIVKKAVKLSGVRDNFEFKGQVQLSRGFRKFYKSEADLSGMIPATVELTQGHSIGIPGHYLRPKETEILLDYEKVIERITLDEKYSLKKRNKELETGQAQEIAQLKAQLEDKERQLRQTVEALEIKSKNSIDKIEKQIVNLNDRIVEITTDNEHGGTHYFKWLDSDFKTKPTNQT